MMQRGSSSLSAILVSLAVLIVLVLALLYVRMRVDLGALDMTQVAFILALFSVGLITVIVYQSFKISETANRIAERMAKDILTYSHELFAELYKGSPVPYLLIDDHGVVTSTNPSTVRLFNCSQGELDGTNIFDVIEGADEQRTSLIPAKLKAGLFVNDEEVRVVRKDGSTRWVMLSLFSFKSSKGLRNGLLTLVDITKQKEIDKAKTEFVSLASHQLRTPISAMKWNIELLTSTTQDTLSALQKEYVKKIAFGIGRMENLITDFLSASKFELGTLTAEKKQVLLDSCITEILEEQYERARSQGVQVHVDLPESPVTLFTDTHLFSTSIGNLVSNAIKYTKDGGVVSLRAVADGDHVVITISDTGIGIPADEQDKLFSKIFRASNARAEVTDGTGLGLYIAKEATGVLGGTISFVSKEHVGTTFTVILPVA